ncbi:MAG: hypothetical protein IJ723_03740 [Ruminococcus sp.]|nr:hypothetical protein [Ruminococcus sp.]
MAKICKSCGKEYKGEFCEHCGYGDPNLKTHAADKYKTKTPVRYMTPEQKEEYYEALKQKQRDRERGAAPAHDPKQVRLLIIVAVVVGLLVIGTLFGTGALGFTEKNNDVIEKYFKAIHDRDFDKYAACFPEEIRKSIEQDLKDTGYTDQQYMEVYCADFAAEYGDDFRINYNLLKTEEMTQYDMTDYKAAYGSVPEIAEAYNVVTDVTFEGSKGSETFRMNCYVGRVGRHWKMFNLVYDAGTITTDMEIENQQAIDDAAKE